MARIAVNINQLIWILENSDTSMMTKRTNRPLRIERSPRPGLEVKEPDIVKNLSGMIETSMNEHEPAC